MVLGKAMTSRINSTPAIRAMRRSYPKCDASMGGGAVAKRIEEKSEFGFGLFGGDAQQLEDPLLNIPPVDTHTPACDFVAVEHQVVGAGPDGRRVGLQVVQVGFQGEVKGWWTATKRFSASSHSTRGNRVTQRKRYSSL